MQFKNQRLDELLRHARECAVIGYTHGAETYMEDAVRYAGTIGARIKPCFQKGIAAKARSNERQMECTFAEIEEEFGAR